MTIPPPLLIDTTSLLRASLDRFNMRNPDDHARTVIESLILFDHIMLDGPSVERNAEELRWLADIEDGIEILDLTSDDQSAIYQSAADVVRHVHPEGNVVDFMRIHMPRELGNEIQAPRSRRSEAFGPSTYWRDLQGEMKSEDLRYLLQVFNDKLGSNVPFSGAPFVAIVRSLYYQCLQKSVGSSLLLDPLKGLETISNQTDMQSHARRILDLFDSQVRDAFAERKSRWLGETPRTLRLPLLPNYVSNEAKRRGWSVGRVILSMRQSREVDLFRNGLIQLQDAIDNNDSIGLDAIFADLDAAAAAWSRQLGIDYKHRQDVSVSVSLPFFSATKSLTLPHLSRRSASDKLLVFVSQLISTS